MENEKQQTEQKKPFVYKIKNHRKKSKVSEDEAYLRMCAVVALNFPKYSLEELINVVPFREVNIMYEAALRWRAETLLYLNGIINGPNEKSKTKNNYKKIIKELSELIK